MGEHDERRSVGASRPGPSTPASSRIRPPAPWSRRSRSAPRSPRKAWATTRASSTRAVGNPTRAALEACVASLERAKHGFAFASGLAAEDNVLRTLRQGDRILLGNDAYGGTFRLISKVWAPLGFPWSAGRPHRRRRASRAELAARHPDGLAGDAHQPAADVRRHRGHRRGRPRARRARGGRQHLRHAVPAAAARARRRHRRALGHQVPRRAQRRRRRVRRGRRRRRSPIGSASPRTRSARCRRRSTATSCCAASRRWPCAWSVTARTPAPWSTCCSAIRRSSACCTRSSPTTRATRPRPPDARLRRDGELHAARGGGEAAALEVVRHTELFTLAESLGAVESLIEHPDG